MVVYLQSVDLFAYCSAEQMVRIAGIAHQERFAGGERIYSANDPAEALYCVVGGEVSLEGPGGGKRTIGRNETFGVVEILSDRLRAEDARAETDASVLAIEADDFFDLLSNNIEIVKALFRQLLCQPGRQSAETADETAETPSRELVAG
jgi:voltage-gated potassium channel